MHKTTKFALVEAYEKGYEDGLKASTMTDIDWTKQNQLNKQWLLDNPNAEYEGWMSI